MAAAPSGVSESSPPVMKEIDRVVRRVLASIPKPPSGDADAEVRHHTLCQAVELLLRNQDKVFQLHGSLSLAVSQNKPRSDDQWSKVPRFVGNMDKTWMAQWLVKFDSKLSKVPMDRELLDHLEANDPKIISLLFFMFTCTGPYAELPQEMKDSRAIAGVAFELRAW